MCKPTDSLLSVLTALVLMAAAMYGAWALADRGPAEKRVNMFREGLRGQRLEADRLVILRSLEAEQVIYSCLLQGRLSLAEAARALRDEHEGRPEHLRPYLSQRENLSEEALYLRMTLLNAFTAVRDDPNRGAVRKRLRAEYEALCGPIPSTPDGVWWIPPEPESR
jgi:hypothetical protein